MTMNTTKFEVVCVMEVDNLVVKGRRRTRRQNWKSTKARKHGVGDLRRR